MRVEVGHLLYVTVQWSAARLTGHQQNPTTAEVQVGFAPDAHVGYESYCLDCWPVTEPSAGESEGWSPGGSDGSLVCCSRDWSPTEPNESGDAVG